LVVIAGRDEKSLQDAKQEIEKESPKTSIKTTSLTISDEASVQKMFNDLPEVPNILVNNAGCVHPSTVAESKVDEWWMDYVSISRYEYPVYP